LQDVGPQAENPVADGELGGAQELGIGLTGHEAGELAGLPIKGLVQLLVEALGFGFLLGR
jgi:hypothetical protein